MGSRQPAVAGRANAAHNAAVKLSNKAWVVAALWVVAVAIAIGLLLGPGGLLGAKHKSPVAAYIEQVDAVERQMQAPLAELLAAYRRYSTQHPTPQDVAAVAKAPRTLATLEQRLLRIEAPPAAAKLRTLLVRLVEAERGVAAELAQLATFLPRLHALTAVAAVANRQLGRALAASAPPKARAVRGTKKQIAAAQAAYAAAARAAQARQADAVEAYDHVLALALRDVNGLHPPAVIAPAYRAELRTLRATRAAGVALVAELRKSNTKRVPELSRSFDQASRLAGSLSAQRAEIAAVRAYNARVRGISALQGKIHSELFRLEREGV